MKIMIIEDDIVIAKAIKNELEKWAYPSYICTDFINAVSEFERENPKLVLLDIGLPNVNGYYICDQIRKISNVPIIFISAMSDKSDILTGMQVGADDYILKPIDLNITISKIRALLRRTYEMNIDFDSLVYKDISLNISKSCIYFNDKSIDLTFTELQIMIELMKNAEKFISRNQLIDRCWKNEYFIDDNALAVNIARLRKKLNKLGLSNIVETKRSVGYRLFY